MTLTRNPNRGQMSAMVVLWCGRVSGGREGHLQVVEWRGDAAAAAAAAVMRGVKASVRPSVRRRDVTAGGTRPSRPPPPPPPYTVAPEPHYASVEPRVCGASASPWQSPLIVQIYDSVRDESA